MPYIFRLNSEPEGTTVDLIADESWSPIVSSDNSDVVETIPVVLTTATDDAMAAQLQALHRIQENVRYYVNEPSSQYTQETWLEWSMLDETSAYGPRRRLVKELEIAFDNGAWFTCGVGNLAPEVRAVLTLRTTGWWEATTTQQPLDNILDTTLMEAIAFVPGAGAIYGDAPARLERLRISQHAGAGVDDIFGAYVAFRSSKRHGTLANFVPLWELELGNDLTDTDPATQAGASPDDMADNCMETTFATDDAFIERINISLALVTANYSANYGRFVVLYRGQVDAATSCTVRVDARAVTATAVVPSPDIPGTAFTVNNATTWRVFDTGLIVQFPPTGTHTTINIFEEYGFTIYASRDSGAGSLYSDCLILVPIDEYMIYYRFGPATYKALGASYMRTWFYFGPGGTTSVMVYGNPSDETYAVDVPYTEGDGVPPGATTWAYFLIFNTDTGDNTLTSDADVTMTAYPRYHSLQGAQ